LNRQLSRRFRRVRPESLEAVPQGRVFKSRAYSDWLKQAGWEIKAQRPDRVEATTNSAWRSAVLITAGAISTISSSPCKIRHFEVNTGGAID